MYVCVYTYKWVCVWVLVLFNSLNAELETEFDSFSV